MLVCLAFSVTVFAMHVTAASTTGVALVDGTCSNRRHVGVACLPHAGLSCVCRGKGGGGGGDEEEEDEE